MSKGVPNPGTEEAVKLSCSCPILDNNYGEGFTMNGVQVFWFTSGCPIHNFKEEEGDEAEG